MKPMSWYHRATIRTKMIVGFMSISVLAVMLMAAFAHSYYSRSMKKDFYEIAQQSVTRINYQLDYYFRQMAQATYTTIAGPLPVGSGAIYPQYESGLIQRWLSEPKSLSRYEIAEIIGLLNQFIAQSYSEINGLFLMSEQREVISSGGYFVGEVMDYKQDPWHDMPIADKLSILPTYHSTYMSSTPYPVISMRIPIYSIGRMKHSGQLVMNLKLSELKKILGQTKLGNSGYFFIVASNGHIVFHPNVDWIGKPLSQTELGSLPVDRPEGVFRWKEKDYLVSINRSELTDWNVVALVPMEEMASGLTISRNSVIVVLLILFFLLMLVLPLLSNSLVKPILRLLLLMRRVEQGDLTVRAPSTKGRDEILMLNNSFNRMIEQLDELMSTVTNLKLKEANLRLKQKDALIQVLQNQINPHLLYNTLDIIKSIAFLEEVPKIEKMAGNLANIYRYTAKIADAEVTLREELDHVAKYLEIIHIRFMKNFQSSIYVNERFMEAVIMKFTLQPIVENAVKYAVEPNGGSAAVIVSAYLQEDDLMVEIADNGPGFTPDKLEEMNQTFQEITEHVELTVSRDSLGLANVHSRLVLQYGEKWGLHLSSFPERGTVVTVRIPFRKREGS